MFYFNNWFKIPKRIMWYVMPILQSEVSEFVEGMKLAQDYQVNKW